MTNFPKPLKVALLPMLHVFNESLNPSGNYELSGGVEAEIVKFISEQLNLTVEIYLPQDGEFGNMLDTGSWTGCMGMVDRGEVDIAVCNLLLTEQRAETFNYSFPYNLENVVFATKIPPNKSKIGAFCYPFSISVWICLICIFVILSIIFRLMNMHSKVGLKEVIFLLYSLFLRQSVTMRFDLSFSNKVFIATWLLCSSVIYDFYNAVFLSFLYRPLTEWGPETTEDLLHVLTQEDWNCFVPKGGTYLDLMKSGDKHFWKVAECIEESQAETDITSDKLKDVFSRSKNVLIASKELLEHTWPVFVSKDFFHTGLVSMYMRKGFCCRSALDRTIKRMIETGILNKIISDYFFRYELEEKLQLKKEYSLRPLSLEDYSGIFIVTIFGYVLAFLIFLKEVIYP